MDIIMSNKAYLTSINKWHSFQRPKLGILGTTMYIIIYVSNLSKIVGQHNAKYHIYADDTEIILLIYIVSGRGGDGMGFMNPDSDTQL